MQPRFILSGERKFLLVFSVFFFFFFNLIVFIYFYFNLLVFNEIRLNGCDGVWKESVFIF